MGPHKPRIRTADCDHRHMLTSLTSSALSTHGAMPRNVCTKNKTLFCNGHTFLMYPFHKQELETNWICPAYTFIGTPKHFWDDFYSGMHFWFNTKCGTWKTFDSLSYTRVNFVSTADISDLCSIIKMTYLLDDFFGHTLHYSWHGIMQPVVYIILIYYFLFLLLLLIIRLLHTSLSDRL